MLDKDARLTIAEELGHGRTQIFNAYGGKATKSNATKLSQASFADSDPDASPGRNPDVIS